MPRPISWLPRLHEIQRSVRGSVRSHYTRQDLEALFALQPRAAQKLIELLPSEQVGTSRLVARESLEKFLTGVQQADDVGAYLETVRSEKLRPSRRKLRSLVRSDLPPVSLASLPQSIQLEPGRLTVSFQSLEQLAENMLTIARLLENEGEEFAEQYEPKESPIPSNTNEHNDLQQMFEDLETLEQEMGRRNNEEVHKQLLPGSRMTG